MKIVMRLYLAIGNTSAEKLYSDIGFRRTEKVNEDRKIEMRYDLNADSRK